MCWQSPAPPAGGLRWLVSAGWSPRLKWRFVRKKERVLLGPKKGKGAVGFEKGKGVVG